MSMLMKFLERLKRDSADAVFITVIIFIPILMIAVGFAADTAKSAYVKNTYHSISQSSVETAVKAINARGSLDNRSVSKFIEELNQQTNSPLSNETLNSNDSTCGTYRVDGIERKLPYAEVTLSTERGTKGQTLEQVWKIERGQAVPNISITGAEKYKVISADVYSGSPNFILGMAGVPCQYLKSSVSAISFGDNQDLR